MARNDEEQPQGKQAVDMADETSDLTWKEINYTTMIATTRCTTQQYD
jgi:hypothetical protein